LIFRLKKQEVVEYLRQGTPEAQQQALGETFVCCYTHLRLQSHLNSIVARESAAGSTAVTLAQQAHQPCSWDNSKST